MSIDRSKRCDICMYVSPPTISVTRLTLHSYLLLLFIWHTALCVFSMYFTLSLSLSLSLRPSFRATPIVCYYFKLFGFCTLYVSNLSHRITLACDYHDKNRHAPCNIWSIYPLCTISNATLNVCISNSLSFNLLVVFTIYVNVSVCAYDRAYSK